MEQITSKIDSQISNGYRNLTRRMSSSDEEMEGGHMECNNQRGSNSLSLRIDTNKCCDCKKITRPTKAYINFNNTRLMWPKPQPAHNHDGTYSLCDLCLSINSCNDIPRIVKCGELFNDFVAGAPNKKKRSMDDETCSVNAVSTISQEANKVLNYIYAHYKDTEGNNPITEAMISHAMQTLKLNVLHTDLPRLFEMVISRHKRGIGRKDYVEHPLSYIVCHMKDLINPLLAFEKSIEGYSYNELLNSLRLQSANYDPDILLKIPIKFDISTMIHPLFVAMFWRQLPTVEGMCVESDQFQLLKNIHITQDKIKPSSYNFDLTTARWNEKSPIAFFGVTNVIDTEIKRVLCHVYLKKIIHRLRTGELHSIDSNKLISWLQKVFIFNSYDTGDDAEQLITAFMNLFLIRPIKLFVQDQVSIGNNCGYLVNTPMEDYMKECPFIYCETTSQVGGVPYSFMPTELNCLRYDKLKNKAILNLNAVNSRQVVVSGTCQPALTCNGLLPIFTRRKATLSYRDMNLLNGEESVEYINTSLLTIPSDYLIDNKTYSLVSVLCYHTIKANNYLSDKEIAAGYYALVKTGSNKWFKYNIHTFSGANNVDALKEKYIQWSKIRMTGEKIYNLNQEQTGVLRFSDEYLGDSFLEKFGNGMVDAQLLEISDEEAKALYEINSCLLIYAEDYDSYKMAMNRFKM